MRLADVHVVVLVQLLALGACSSDGIDGSNLDGSFADSGSGNDGGGALDASGPGLDAGRPDGGSVTPCVPTDCAAQGKNCGAIADGCGGILQCGECVTGEVCSLATANVCGDPNNLCEPSSRELACAAKACGFESDGCDGVHDCGTCGPGTRCENFVCIDGGEGECTGRIVSCASVGAECGLIGDGCGGVIDCNTELGGCASGTYCGILAPSRCDAPPPCESTVTSCAELGWECGVALDHCGNPFPCADEGRTCGALQVCTGGIHAPARCTSTQMDCPLCDHVPNCSGQPQVTRITGRVITPGRTDGNTGNHIGVPNAYVYIPRRNDVSVLPAIDEGLPAGDAQRCDRCENAALGPVLTGAVSDARGEYTLEGNIPVGEEFLLVVKVGKFRRAVRMTIPGNAACQTTALPTTMPGGNPTRLPRNLQDGLAVHIPRVAIATGRVDAMECVLEKMGLDHALFTRPSENGRLHLYRDNGAFPDAQSLACEACTDSTCRQTHCGGSTTTDRSNFLAAFHQARLWEDGGRLGEYDFVISDCGGGERTDPTTAGRVNLRRYVNRGGRVFASHFSDSWVKEGSGTYNASNPLATGLAPAVTYGEHPSGIVNGTGIISQARPNTSPRIQTFIDWMVRENAVLSSSNLTFNIPEPRSRATALGPYTEEFVRCQGGTGSWQGTCDPFHQQLAFYTPYAPPAADAACGRVVYTGFHVAPSITTYTSAFPDHCQGDLNATEKTLAYLLFDLGACVGSEPTPPTCEALMHCPADTCGNQPDGCGGSLDCGPCVPSCSPLTCESQNAQCGIIGDGCGGTVNCGPCPMGQSCGAQAPNQCGSGMCTPRGCPEGAECGQAGDGCGGVVQCGTCPLGQVCGIETPYRCGPPPGCTPVTCESVNAECGPIPDGCGGVRDCGDCPPGNLCGTTQVNRCSPVVI